ncbi:hypothetical protein K525DRAFT_285576 [Schizophyllum commune Loenen D]|nr:hypothetical protein K525DRAFT_285576 [Schizophyllum commune Loenen D]
MCYVFRNLRILPSRVAEDGRLYLTLGRMEWLWGLPRGGMSYYRASRLNNIPFREDIARMYTKREFILAPTFKLYCEIADFIKHSGVLNRSEEDESPRRPLTAMCPPSGLYRYVFIPFSDAARKLRTEFNMQPQTEDDQNGDDRYPITKSPAHPYSVSSYATMVFNFSFIDGTAHTAQWAILVGLVERQWRCPVFTVPQWFLDAPKKGENDYEVTGSEKSGYSLGSLINSLRREPGDLGEILKVSEVDYLELREKVLEWFERDQQPSKLRRSKRIAERMARATSCTSASKPYSHTFATKPSSHAAFSDPPSLPRRRRRRKASSPPRSYHPNDFKVPEWVQQNGHFPTREFSSNDWAFFYYSTSLEGRITDRQSGP